MLFIRSFCSLSCVRSKASAKACSPQSAIYCFLYPNLAGFFYHDINMLCACARVTQLKLETTGQLSKNLIRTLCHWRTIRCSFF